METNRWVGRKSGGPGYGSVGRAAGWAGGLGWAGLDGLGVVGWLWGGGWGLGLGWDTLDSVRYEAVAVAGAGLGWGWAGAGAGAGAGGGGGGYLIFESDSVRGSAWLDWLGWLGKGVGRAGAGVVRLEPDFLRLGSAT